MFYYLNNFLLFSTFGFLYENMLHLFLYGHMTNNPFYGPWMPIYGFGIVIMIILTRFVFHRFKMPKIAKIVCLFFLCLFILTVLEQLGGMITEAVFHKSFWDYSNLRFHYGKYIALEVSLGWGVACLIFLYLVKPWTDKVVERIPHIVSIALSILFLVDFVFSFFVK